MIKILFVCHGNICRSPMAEFVMKDLVKKAGLSDQFKIASAATSSEEIWNGMGNPVYRPAAKKLAEHGLSCAGKRAQQLDRSDYKMYDLLIGMDSANIRNMHRMCGGDVADPWYTRDYETAWQDILEGCTALLEELRKTL